MQKSDDAVSSSANFLVSLLASARQQDPMLWSMLLGAGALLSFAILQAPVARVGPTTWAQRLSEPIEINPAQGRPVLPASDIHALWFFSRDEGLLAGESGLLLRTEDGGRTWQRSTVNDPAAKNGIFALGFRGDSQGEGYAAGANGLLLATNDRGRTWVPRIVRAPTNVQLSFAQTKSVAAPAASEAAMDPLARGAHVYGIGGVGVRSLHLATTAGAFALLPGNRPPTFTTEFAARAYGVAVIPPNKVFVATDANAQVARGAPIRSATAQDMLIYFPGATALGSSDEAVVAGGDGFYWARPDGTLLAWFNRPLVVTPGRLNVARVIDRERAVVAGERGQVWWLRPEQQSGVSVLGFQVRGVPGYTGTFFAAWSWGDEVLLAGADGVMFATRDAGLTWERRSANCWPLSERTGRYVKLPSPASFAGLLLLAALGFWRWRALPARVELRAAVANELESDRPLLPGEADRLGFAPFVRGLSAYLRNAATQPPLTLAITGDWGAGKSSLMNLLRADLDERGLRTVWFNAWHHQQEAQILVPLLAAIQEEAPPRVFSRQMELAVWFRLRLLARRLLAQWPLAVAATVVLAVAAGALSVIGPISPGQIAQWWKADEKDTLESLLGLAGGGSLIGTVGGLLLFGWRALKAFGVEPASLLATQSGTSRPADRGAQSVFRREFAEQFEQVTAALRPYRLVIFIDDLDRCEPAKVFQILEAINYLVSSGECIMVLGMSEERVRDAVALGFRDLPADFGESWKAGQESGELSAAAKWERQRTVARQYLEKLIQVQVRVPRLRPESAAQLVAAAEARARREAPRSWKRFLPPLPVWGAVAAAAIFYGAFVGGKALAPLLPQATEAAHKSVASEPPVRNELPAGAENGSDSVDPAAPAFRERQVANLDVANRTAGVGVVVTSAVLILLAAALAIALRWRVLVREVVVRDSGDFSAACRRWAEGLHALEGARLTPRALKRFKNRVRFYAMLRTEEGSALLPGVSDAGLVALGAIEQAGFILPGRSITDGVDFDALMNSALEDALKEEATEAVGSIRAGEQSRATFDQARESFAKA